MGLAWLVQIELLELWCRSGLNLFSSVTKLCKWFKISFMFLVAAILVQFGQEELKSTQIERKKNQKK